MFLIIRNFCDARFHFDSATVEDAVGLYSSRKKGNAPRLRTRPRTKPDGKAAAARVGAVLQNPPSEVYAHLPTDRYKPDLKLGDIKFTAPKKKHQDDFGKDIFDF